MPIFLQAQNDTLIKGLVRSDQGQPIPYATIGIPAEQSGTISDEEGSFSFSVPRGLSSDSLRFSAIGYHSKWVSIDKAIQRSVFTLSPKTYEMETVRVNGHKPKKQWLGKKIRPFLSPSFGQNVPHNEIGAAYAFKVTWNGRVPVRLLHARMFLTENDNSTLRMRCRVVSVEPKSGRPGEDLMPISVVTVTDKNRGWVTCNMEDKNWYIHREEFYLVFEWLPKEGQTYTPMFAAGLSFDSEVYNRRNAVGKWKKNPNNLIYSLKIEY